MVLRIFALKRCRCVLYVGHPAIYIWGRPGFCRGGCGPQFESKCLRALMYKALAAINIKVKAKAQPSRPAPALQAHRSAVQHHRAPVHRPEFGLARWVPQCLPGPPCARPAARQIQQVQGFSLMRQWPFWAALLCVAAGPGAIGRMVAMPSNALQGDTSPSFTWRGRCPKCAVHTPPARCVPSAPGIR